MTRLASVSVIGVAVVATMVLLSGCPQPATDYAKELEGTWMGNVMATVRNPAPAGPPTFTVPTDVTVVVTATKKNAGDIELKVVNNFPSPPAGIGPVTTEGSGTFTVDATVVKATLETISDTAPDVAKGLKGVEQAIEWKRVEDKLMVTNKTLFSDVLGISESIDLTKQ